MSAALMLERARDYVRRGFSVIPLVAGGKKPIIAWGEFQQRQATDAELQSWFSGPSPANLGIVTGSISGVDVIDCDSQDAAQRAAELGLPTSPIVRTGKGWHFYYAHEPGARNFQARTDLPGIDFRGDGGFVVAPPSVHESGAIYRWEGELRPLPPLPRWILQGGDRNLVRLPVSFTEGAGEGSRNMTLARLVGALAVSVPIEAGRTFALWWGTQLCNPPMEIREIDRTVRSIYAKEGRKEELQGWAPEERSGSVVRVADLLEKLESLYTTGIQSGEKTGWAKIDNEELYSVKRGQWTVITGVPGHGKSSWLDQLMVQLAVRADWRFAIFSAENMPIQRHVAGLIEKFLAQPFNDGPTPRITREAMRHAAEALNRHFFFMAPEEGQENLSTILKIAAQIHEAEGLDSVVIDPWNEIDHSRPATLSETEYISKSLSQIRRFARTHNVHVFVVAHPTKLQRDKNGKYPLPDPNMISGSAAWRAKADAAICVSRDDERQTNTIHVQKIRFREIGRIGEAELYYDQVTGRFTDEPLENHPLFVWRPE